MPVASLLLVLPLAGLAVLAWRRARAARAEVRRLLASVHAHAVVVACDWRALQRDALTFDVRWTDAAGAVHVNRCRVRRDPLTRALAIYWRDPIFAGESRLPRTARAA